MIPLALLRWLQNRRLARQRLADEYAAAQAARPCVEHFSYATSLGGLIECGTHGMPYSNGRCSVYRPAVVV